MNTGSTIKGEHTMSQPRSWLAGLLALQLALAGLLAWQHGSSPQVASEQPLVAFNPTDVDRLVIDAGDDSVTLQRSDGRWQLPELDNLPVREGAAADLVAQLADLRRGWPVATSDAGLRRFAVADDDYRKRLRLYRGDTLVAEYYLGEAAGLRQTHLRAAGDDAVYQAPLDNYAVQTRAADWLDKGLLAVAEPSAVSGPDYRIEKQGEHWQFSDTAAGVPAAGVPAAGAPAAGAPTAEPPADAAAVAAGGASKAPADGAGSLDAQALSSLTDTLASLRVTGVASAPGTPPQFTLTVRDAAGPHQFRLWQQGDDYLVQRDDRDSVFSLGKTQFEALTGANRDTLAGAAEDAGNDTVAHSAAGDDGNG
jgi:Domain of unknown function (DUF4340)